MKKPNKTKGNTAAKAAKNKYIDQKLEQIKAMNLRTDEFYRFAAQEHPEILSEIVRIVKKKSIGLKKSNVQQIVSVFPKFKEGIVDSIVEDDEGKLYAIDVQNTETDPDRFVNYGIELIVWQLKKGESWTDFNDVSVIVLLADGVIKPGTNDKKIEMPDNMPVEHVYLKLEHLDRRLPFGLDVYFVNGNYKGQDELGDLNRSFDEADPEKIPNEIIQHAMKQIKTPEGEKMVEQFFEEKFPAFLEEKTEKAREEGREEGRVEGSVQTENTVFQLLNKGKQEKKKGKNAEEIKASLKAEGASDEVAAKVTDFLF